MIFHILSVYVIKIIMIVIFKVELPFRKMYSINHARKDYFENCIIAFSLIVFTSFKFFYIEPSQLYSY